MHGSRNPIGASDSGFLIHVPMIIKIIRIKTKTSSKAMNILQSCRHLQCPASHQIRIQTQHVIQIPQIIKINPESTRAVQKVLICKLPPPGYNIPAHWSPSCTSHAKPYTEVTFSLNVFVCKAAILAHTVQELEMHCSSCVRVYRPSLH